MPAHTYAAEHAEWEREKNDRDRVFVTRREVRLIRIHNIATTTPEDGHDEKRMVAGCDARPVRVHYGTDTVLL